MVSENANTTLRGLIKTAVEAYEAAAATAVAGRGDIERQRDAVRKSIDAAGGVTPRDDLANLAGALRQHAAALLEQASLAHLRGLVPGPSRVIAGLPSGTDAEAAAAFAAAQTAAADLRISLLAFARKHLELDRVDEANVLVNLIADSEIGEQLKAEKALLRKEIATRRAAAARRESENLLTKSRALAEAGDFAAAQSLVEGHFTANPQHPAAVQLLRTIRLGAVAAQIEAGQAAAAQAAALMWHSTYPDAAELREVLLKAGQALVRQAGESELANVAAVQAGVLRGIGLEAEARAVTRGTPALLWLTGAIPHRLFEFGGHAQEIVDVAFLDRGHCVSIDGSEAKTWALGGHGAGKLIRTVPMAGAVVLSGDGRFAGRGATVRATEDGRTCGTAGPQAPFAENCALTHDGSVVMTPVHAAEAVESGIVHRGGLLGTHSEGAKRALAVSSLRAVRGKQALTSVKQVINQARQYTDQFCTTPCVGVQLRGVEQGWAKDWHSSVNLSPSMWIDVAVSYPAGVVAVLADSGTLWVMDGTRNMQVTHTFTLPPARNLDALLRVSASGRLLLAAPGGIGHGHPSELTVWDVPTGRVACKVSHVGPNVHALDHIAAADISPDDRIVVLGTAQGFLMTVDVSSGSIKSIWQGHTGGVRAVSFSADGDLIVTGGADRIVKVWGSQ